LAALLAQVQCASALAAQGLRVFARVSALTKLMLVQQAQAGGHAVAMIVDGAGAPPGSAPNLTTKGSPTRPIQVHNQSMNTKPLQSALRRAMPAVLRATGLAALGLLWAVAGAQSSSQSLALQPPVLPRWEAGAFGVLVSQQAYPGADQQVQRSLVLPYLIYRGEILRSERGGAGLRAFKTDALELDLGAAAALGSSATRIEARQGMPDLGTLVEVGPRLRWTLASQPDGSIWRLDLPLRSVHDLGDGLQRRGTTFEPALKWQGPMGSGFFVTTGLSAVVADRQLGQTFYGVERSQATVARPTYSARAGLITWRLSGSLSWRMGTNWNAFTYARMDSVAGAANESSPLIRQTTGLSAGLGLSYTWLRSSLPAVD
jgi:outer membrane scaffolding protein for murein synthesis (MipA/OmpV family)